MGIILFQVMRVEALAGIRPVVTRSEAIPVPVIGGAHEATCRSGRAPRGAWRSMPFLSAVSAAAFGRLAGVEVHERGDRAGVGGSGVARNRQACSGRNERAHSSVSYRAQPQTVDDDDQAMANAIAMTEAEPW